jgi:hypothetical protein
MCENVNINVSETNETINIVSSEIQEVIDINVFETTEDVTLNITEEIIQVNINKVTGGGGEETLAETLEFGNNTGGTDILLNSTDSILLENNSSLRKGTYDFGQGGGISRVCGIDYEDMWQGGIRHVFDTNGFIRNSTNGFNTVPNFSFDVTLRFKVGSIWTLDDGTNYICTDNTEGAAVWELYNEIPTNTSDLTNDGEDGVNPFITAADIPAAVTSVGLTMPSAFSVANSPITSAGTLEVTGAGLVSQYVRGDGSLANFPTSTGGGASLSFYLNGSVSQGTFGGVAFREMDRTPILGAGTDFTIAANGYIQSFITDAGVPNLLEIPAGNWNFETYFSASSGGGSPSFYVELYKWDGTTLSLIASNSANPEGITNGTAIDLYVSALAVPQTTLLATDRLAVRIYVTTSGRTIKLHTEDNHLCQVITTFSTGITALNGLTTQVQSFATGTSGTDFAISSATATHTFNLPTASAVNRGALSSTDWSTFNGKQAALVSGTNIKTINGNSVLGSGDLIVGGSTSLAIGTTPITSGTIGRVLFEGTGNVLQQSANLFWDNTNNRLGIGTATPTQALDILGTNVVVSKIRSSTNTGATIFQGFNDLNNSCEYGIIGSTRAGTGALASGNAYLYGGVDLAVTSLTNIKFGVGSILNERMRIFGATGNIVIQSGGTITDAGFKLDVNGTARVQGRITALNGANMTLTSNYAAEIGFNVNGRLGIGYNVASGSIIQALFSTSAADLFIQPFGGALMIGENVLPNTSASVQINSTTKGFLPPRMTTTQKNAISTPAAGLVVYDTTLNKLCVRTASSWETITSI